MKNLIEIKKKFAEDWFKYLQSKIINQFQILENEKKKMENIGPRVFLLLLI